MSKRVFAFVLISSAVFGAAWSCGFPDVSFAPEGGGETSTGEGGNGGEGGGGEGGGGEGGGGNDGASDGPKVNPDVDPEGGAQDATVLDGSTKIEAGPDATCCDCDDDTFNKVSASCTSAQADCDDLNTAVKPGANFVASGKWESDHLPAYDWDCSGAVVKQYVYGLGACNQQLKLSGCAARQGGFEGDPACGVPGKFIVTCAADSNLLNLNCTETKSETRTQGCR